MKLYFVTSNQNKFDEAKAIILSLEQYNVDLDEIQETDTRKIVSHKLKQALGYKKANFIVEGGSLSLECLGGLPGPLIKWFWRSLGNQGVYELCKKYNNFNAEAAVIVGYTNGKQIKFFAGKTRGKIVNPVSKKGFGYDPIFIPQGSKKTYHEMTLDEKNKISHRQKALGKLSRYLISSNFI